MSATRSRLVLGVVELTLAATLIILAAGISLTAVMRHFDPVHWGLWVSPQMFLFGVVDDPTQAHEVLGDRIYSIAALVVLLSALATRESWQVARAHLLGSPRP